MNYANSICLNKIVLPALLVLAAGIMMQPAYSQFQQGGVDHPGDWYVGEGLKHGDLFSYRMCFEAYKECRDFEMDMWIQGDAEGKQDTWLAQVVVYDGNRVIKGHMDIAKVSSQPTGGSEDLDLYRSSFKSSIVWLSSFANQLEPKQFSAVSWGKIGNIGGEQILPMEILERGLTVEARTFEEVIQVGWRTGGYTSKVYVVDEFPFPIQAETWQHVSEGIPPPEYRFELLDYQENVQENPFADIEATASEFSEGCPTIGGLDNTIKRTTVDGKYSIHIFYAPEIPIKDCPMTWQIQFLNKFDETEFHTLVHYDLLAVDENQVPIRSIAQDERRNFLYSPSGLAKFDIIVREGPGTANYAIVVYGKAPENVVPNVAQEQDFLYVDLQVDEIEGVSKPAVPGPADAVPSGDSDGVSPPAAAPPIPEWIKGTANLWSGDESISDDTFINAVQFLVQDGVIVVPDTERSDDASSAVPVWFKGTTQLWASGTTSDAEFINAIQFLIREGVIVL